MNEENLRSKIVLGEIAGKNQAIHAYDKIVWTIRSGFLTLFYAGWGYFLKSIVSDSSGIQNNLNYVIVAMLLVTVTLSAGGLIIDQNYVRRKFRVIYALDELMLIILRKGDQDLKSNLHEIEKFVQVSGDKDDTNYLNVSGYGPAWKAGLVIYLVPVIVGISSVVLLWK